MRGSPAKLLKIDFKYGENERYGLTTEAEYYDFFDSSICDGKVVLERIGPNQSANAKSCILPVNSYPWVVRGVPTTNYFDYFHQFFSFCCTDMILNLLLERILNGK